MGEHTRDSLFSQSFCTLQKHITIQYGLNTAPHLQNLFAVSSVLGNKHGARATTVNHTCTLNWGLGGEAGRQLIPSYAPAGVRKGA